MCYFTPLLVAQLMFEVHARWEADKISLTVWEEENMQENLNRNANINLAEVKAEKHIIKVN